MLLHMMDVQLMWYASWNSIMEFKDNKVAHETLYFGDPFEPPEWRSQWVERIK
jgi:hypothetical protein